MKKQKKQPLFNPDELIAHVQSGVSTAIDTSLVYGYHDVRDQAFLLSQRADLVKKYVSTTGSDDLMELEAFIKFEAIQAVMRNVNRYPYPNPSIPIGLDISSRRLLKARAIVHRVLGDFCEDEWFSACRHSSGSSIGVPYRDTSPEAKFRGLTASNGVERWFKYYLQYDGTLSNWLESSRRQVKLVRGSLATTVPKDNTKVRMICIEPTLNMFFQQGLMACVTSRLERVGLSFDVQQVINRESAFLSSLTGRCATIDWSSASDTIAYSLVKFLLPPKWFYHLDCFRSPEMEILGQFMPLESYSTMGNATTFPVETLVFWAMAQAVCDDTKSTLGPEEFNPLVQVFGDDCILPVEYAQQYIDFMSRFGFKPNTDKTFITGRFRESCGGDFLAGRDVRPYYLTGPSGETLNHLHAWLNIMFNRLLNRCIRIWGPLKYMYCSRAIFDTLFSLFRKYGVPIYLVPTHFPDDAGLKIGADLARFLCNYRIRDLLSKISVDRHGTKYFLYLSAYYPQKKFICKKIRIWMALKGVSTVSPRYTKVRKDPQYIVAKGATCFFTVNRDGKH